MRKRLRGLLAGRLAVSLSAFRFHRQDADDPAVSAVIGELDLARDLREEGVVLAATDVQARPEPAAALANEDRPARHQIAVMALHAKPLRIAVASVARTALPFLVSHWGDP